MGRTGVLFFELWFLIFAMDYTNGFSSTYSAKSFSKNVTQLLDSLLANYDKRIRPGHGGKPTFNSFSTEGQGKNVTNIINI